MAKFKALYSEKDFVEKLVALINSLTIKYEELAYQNETTESHTAATRYLAAVDEWDNFGDYSYSEQELIEVGFTPAMAGFEAAVKDQNNVPEEFREQLLANKRVIVISEYTELNEYYRVLNGLPPLGNEYYYFKTLSKYVSSMTDKEVNTYREDLVTISKTDLVNLKYLRYLGEYKIDVYKARKADNFEILQYDTLQFDTEVLRKFLDFYDQSKAFIWNVYYNKGFMDYPYYENFIALMIAFDTMQKFIAYQITLGIKRDFFDKESIKNILVSFGIPYVEEIPTAYQIRLIKNMNQILQHKGTNKVLFDLCDLFSYGEVNLYKYYLVKDFKAYNSKGPIIDLTQDKADMYDLFFQKVPIDAKNLNDYINNKEYQLDYDSVVEDDAFWGENVPGLENDLESLKEEIKNKEFNYLCTKYLSVDMVVNLTKVLYETTYFFNLVNTLNKQGSNIFQELYFYSEALKASKNKTTLWDAILAVYYLLYHRFGYSAVLQYRPEAVGRIYGFDFSADNLQKINSAIDKYLHKFKSEAFREKYAKILTLPTENLTSSSALVEKFLEYTNWIDTLKDAMITTEDKAEYRALREIYDILTTTSSVRNIFSNKTYTHVTNETPTLLDSTKLVYRTLQGGLVNTTEKPVKVYYNGALLPSTDFTVDQLSNTVTFLSTIADTSLVTIEYDYLEIDFTYANLHDYLLEKDSELLEYCDYYIDLDNEKTQLENISTAVLTIIDLIQQYLNREELDDMFAYFNLSYSFSFRKYLYKMLNTFKAYTVDIHSISTIFLVQDRTNNALKLIDEMLLTSQLNPAESLKLKLIDHIISTTVTLSLRNDNFYEQFIELIQKVVLRILKEDIDFKELLTVFLSFSYANRIPLNDQIGILLKDLDLESSIDLKELSKIIPVLEALNTIPFEETLNKLNDKGFYLSLFGSINEEIITQTSIILETNSENNRNMLKLLFVLSYFGEYVKETTISLITLSLFEECQLDGYIGMRIPLVDTLEITYE